MKSFQQRKAAATRRSLELLPEADRPPMTITGAKPKACGECQECCFGMRIEAFNKPSYTKCQHQCESGCSIYRAKPDECNHYACAYVLGVLIGDVDLRPDNLGVIIDFRPSVDPEGNELGDGEILVCFRETRAYAGTSDKVWSLIERFAATDVNLILVPFKAPETDGGRRSTHLRLKTSSRSNAPGGLFEMPGGNWRAKVFYQCTKILEATDGR